VSWSDSILSSTIGVAYRAYTGNVDPWTLQNLKDDAHADNAVALGANDTSTYGEVDPGDLAIANAKTDSSIDLTDTASYLKAAEHVVYALLAIGAVAGAGYFVLKYRHTLKGLTK
jgi:hypothetical protein